MAEGGLECRDSGCSRLVSVPCWPGRDRDLYLDSQTSSEQAGSSLWVRQDGRLVGYPDQLLFPLWWSQLAWLGYGVGWLYPSGRLCGGRDEQKLELFGAGGPTGPLSHLRPLHT